MGLAFDVGLGRFPLGVVSSPGSLAIWPAFALTRFDALPFDDTQLELVQSAGAGKCERLSEGWQSQEQTGDRLQNRDMVHPP